MPALRCFLVLLLLLQGWGTAQDKVDISPDRLGGLRRELNAILKQHEIPGIGVALVNAEGAIWTGGVGVADLKTHRRVTEGTVFRVGSVSKTLVALAAMMLVEEAKLDLQSPLVELAPEVAFRNRWEETHPVRMVHLMEHTAGWDGFGPREFAHNESPPIALEKGLEFAAGNRTSRWPPGRSMSYCNSGPAVAAYVIEKLSGTDYEQFVRERVFRPLGMPLTGFHADGEVGERLATGYRDGVAQPYWNFLLRPSGSLNTTPKEIANYLQMFIREGELNGVRLVKPESIDRMMHARSARSVQLGLERSYGLGLVRMADQGQIWFEHRGRLRGYQAELAWCPRLKLGYAFMINSRSGAGARLTEVFRRFLAEGHEAVENPPVHPVSDEQLQSRTGYYQALTHRHKRQRFLAPYRGMIRIEAATSALTLAPVRLGRRSPVEKLVPISDHAYRRDDNQLASVVFLDGEDDGIVSLGLEGDYRRVPEEVVWLRWGLAGVALALMASTLLWAVIWLPRLLSRRFRRNTALAVRATPLVATLSFLAAGAFVWNGMEVGIHQLGEISIWSVGYLVGSLAFVVSAIAALCVAFRARSAGRFVRRYTVLVASAQVLLALYLAYWGVIGYPTWM